MFNQLYTFRWKGKKWISKTYRWYERGRKKGKGNFFKWVLLKEYSEIITKYLQIEKRGFAVNYQHNFENNRKWNKSEIAVAVAVSASQ